MRISQNRCLCCLLGCTYGGDGKSSFGVPNLQGCAPMQEGQGPGLSLRSLGETGGEQAVTLLQTEMPAQSHNAQAALTGGGVSSPANNAWASGLKGHPPAYAPS